MGFTKKSSVLILKLYVEEELSDGYRPVKYIFVDKFPLTKAGKIDYITLEKEAEKL